MTYIIDFILSLPLDAIRWSVELWLLYIAIMSLRDRWEDGKLSGPVKIIAVPVAVCAFALDIVLNYTLYSLLFAELPQEKTVSERLDRYANDPTHPKRQWICRIIGKDFLNPFDNNHINIK